MDRVQITGRSAPDPTARLEAAVAALLRFGAMALRAGDVGYRTRASMEYLAATLGLQRVSVELAFDGVTVSASQDGHAVTATTRVSGHGVNSDRLLRLDRLTRHIPAPLPAGELSAALDRIERVPPRHARWVVALAVALASACFALLNGAGPPVMLAAAVGAGLGQTLRARLLAARFNQFVVTSVSAIAASAIYACVSAGLGAAGLSAPQHAAGFISSVLFLVPGFPLVAALTDLVQSDLTIGVTRLAYATMIVLAGGFGISMVAGAAALNAGAPPLWHPGVVPLLAIRAVATLAGGCGFAVLYNSAWRIALAVGGLAMVGNVLRLTLHDAGMNLAPATFLGALTVGLTAHVASRRMAAPRIIFSVPGIIMMVPGTYLFTALIRLEQGEILDALANLVPGSFIIGAMAIGLVTTRLLAERTWLHDQ